MHASIIKALAILKIVIFIWIERKKILFSKSGMRKDKREGARMDGWRVDNATSRGKNIKEREKEADRNEEEKKNI